jgi:hypothetical protein
MKHFLVVIAALTLAGSIAAISSSASSSAPRTLDLTGTVTGSRSTLDASPPGPSPGDMGYTTGVLFENGKQIGRFQGVCTMLPRSSQQCSFTLGLPRGQLIVESGYGPGFNTGSVALEAVVGGTGAYAGVHGQGRDREVTNTKLAFRLELTG